MATGETLVLLKRITPMKIRSILPVVLLGFTAYTSVPTPTLPKPDTTITGDYVEARTASVFAGACHYNGELVTGGRDAILAWNITQGSWNGVDLAGVRAMAAISSEQNLGEDHAARKTELVIDPFASNAQAGAVTDWLRSFDSAQLGTIVSTHRSAISFRHDDGLYTINANGYAAMTVQPMPNNECCTQPHLVWYNPLMPLEHRKVGYTQSASYFAGTVGDPWDRWDENSAFYGRFSIAAK
jgi:hypothetical protein